MELDRFFSSLVVRNIYKEYSQKIENEKLSLFSKIKSFIPIYNIIDFLMIPKIKLSKKIFYLVIFFTLSTIISAIIASPTLLVIFFTKVDSQLYFNVSGVLIYFLMSLCFILGKYFHIDEIFDWKYSELLTKDENELIRNQYGEELVDLILENYFENKELTYRDLLYFDKFIKFIKVVKATHNINHSL